MSRTSRKRTGLVVPGAVVVVADRAGAVAGPLRDRVVDGAGELAERAGPLRDRVLEGTDDLRIAAAPLVGEALERSGAAWSALRGEQAPVAPVRRWTWAVGAALAGAAAGAVAAAVVRKVAPADAPGAQEPHELRAVVDTSDTGAVRLQETGPAAASPPVAQPTFEM